MRLTIIQTGEVPEPLRDNFGPYHSMFERMFDATENGFSYEVVDVEGNSLLPDPSRIEGIVITGSPAGVYEDHDWLPPLREFIRRAYSAKTPMLGVCFGHQIMADALGGDVRKSEKGWGLGRHAYRVAGRPDFMADAPETLAIACSHQDQVIVPPAEAEVILASDFTPNAGLFYKSGKALSFQPHPEFLDDYAMALVELRRGRAPEEVVEQGVASFAQNSDSARMADYIGKFFRGNTA
ncbi:gamma-glutamyl-gamma-aminobutyrate hydrolase family protein [Devosia sp.]|uniref:glutamine amidotransferase-related protein n=1 Tax=Devosia sp. TaxID=1871048 RepID=UPI001B2C8D4D|nr:gamma-glutamyl-gamma-aminobutyrate hydrolase family protein [Devosia sp.]MBO9589041.1 gamma-glutamyl-gamma-aminobutyrate hydrolase family protein [Devosia sp.]